MPQILLPDVNDFNSHTIYPYIIGPFTIRHYLSEDRGWGQKTNEKFEVNAKFQNKDYYCGSFTSKEDCENWFKGFQNYFQLKENK